MNAIEIDSSKMITARGSEREPTCYSYVDTNANDEGWTYYYLLEDLDIDGNRTFHWDYLTSIPVGSMN